MSEKSSAEKTSPYESTVMLRITGEFKMRLDMAAETLAKIERANGRARKVGRATIVYEAMQRGLPLLEKEMEKEVGCD